MLKKRLCSLVILCTLCLPSLLVVSHAASIPHTYINSYTDVAELHMPRIVFKYNPEGFVLVGDNRYMAKSEIKPLGFYPRVGFPAEDGEQGTLYRRHYRKWKIDGDHIVTSYME